MEFVKAESTHRDGGSSLVVTGCLCGVDVEFLVDTGAYLTIVKPEVFKQIADEIRPELEDVHLDITLADGSPLKFYGRGRFSLNVGGMSVEHDVFVAEIDLEGILGCDFLTKYHCLLDLGHGQMFASEKPVVCREGGSHCLQNRCCKLTVKDTVVIPSSSETVVPGEFRGEFHGGLSMFETSESFLNRHELIVARGVVDAGSSEVPLRILNLSSKDVKIYKGTVAAVLSPADVVESENDFCEVQSNSKTLKDDERFNGMTNEVPEYLFNLRERSQTELSPEERLKLDAFLN